MIIIDNLVEPLTEVQMNLIWNFEHVKIPDVMTVYHFDGSVFIKGTGIYGDWPFEWNAIALQGGYYITIISLTGKRGEFQGSTFNLGLEVAAAVKRLL